MNAPCQIESAKVPHVYDVLPVKDAGGRRVVTYAYLCRFCGAPGFDSKEAANGAAGVPKLRQPA